MSAPPDDFLFSAGDAEYELVLDEKGEPVNGGAELVSVVRTSPAVHTRFGLDDVRIYADLLTVRTGQRVFKAWFLVCGGGCPKKTGDRCKNPKPKKGAAGLLRNDFFVATGRRLTSKERVPRSVFLGQTFVAELVPVVEDGGGTGSERKRTFRERGEWYTKAGPFLARSNFLGENPPISIKEHCDSITSPVPFPVGVPVPFPFPSSTPSSTVDDGFGQAGSGGSRHELKTDPEASPTGAPPKAHRSPIGAPPPGECER